MAWAQVPAAAAAAAARWCLGFTGDRAGRAGALRRPSDSYTYKPCRGWGPQNKSAVAQRFTQRPQRQPSRRSGRRQPLTTTKLTPIDN
eukprot:358687-Chlamydomonas_euryale.AAC.3